MVNVFDRRTWRAVRRDWPIEQLQEDLRRTEWERPLGGRTTRFIRLGSYERIEELVQAATSKRGWKKAVENDDVHEIVDRYLGYLAGHVGDGMVEEVDSNIDANGVYLVQYVYINTLPPGAFGLPRMPGVLDWRPGEE